MLGFPGVATGCYPPDYNNEIYTPYLAQSCPSGYTSACEGLNPGAELSSNARTTTLCCQTYGDSPQLEVHIRTTTKFLPSERAGSPVSCCLIRSHG